MTVEMIKNPDILKTIGESKKKEHWLVGFALETSNAIENGTKKLKAKNLDLIVINTLEDKGAGFGHDTNKVTLLDKNNKTLKFELQSKKDVADNILDYLLKIIK